MKRVYVNEKWCLGCRLCEYYCAFASAGGADISRALKGKTIVPRVHVENAYDPGGATPSGGSFDVTFAVSCRHCVEPYCVKSCISGALGKKDGVVSVDKNKCIGCYTCVLSCPYGCITATDDGVIDKCELCTQTSEGTPRCVAGCPNQAIVYEER